MTHELIPALGYLRTSSATNIGADRDSDKRQREAIERMAARNGYAISDWYYDAGISGDVPILERPQFIALLDRIDGNGVRTVIVESADRFARKMLVAELGVLLLINRGVTLLTATDDNMTDTDDPMRVAFRQIALAFAQLEKARLVAKLKGARLRKRAATGRCEGRKQAPEIHRALAKSLRAEGLSLRTIAERLEQAGYVGPNGKRYFPKSIKCML